MRVRVASTSLLSSALNFQIFLPWRIKNSCFTSQRWFCLSSVLALSFLCHPEGRNIFRSFKVSGELFRFGNGMRPWKACLFNAYFADVSKTLAFSAWGQGSGVKGQAAINLAQGILFSRTTFSVPLLLWKERIFGKKKKSVCFGVGFCFGGSLGLIFWPAKAAENKCVNHSGRSFRFQTQQQESPASQGQAYP